MQQSPETDTQFFSSRANEIHLRGAERMTVLLGTLPGSAGRPTHMHPSYAQHTRRHRATPNQPLTPTTHNCPPAPFPFVDRAKEPSYTTRVQRNCWPGMLKNAQGRG